MTGMLHLSALADFTGRGVRVAVIDSGVHASHPHVQGVSGGVSIDPFGVEEDEYLDRLGHGTAVTAIIREKAPAAEVYCIKVFDRELATTAEALVAAIRWAIAQGAHLINLSLGTSNAAHEAALAHAVAEAERANVIVVAAAPEAHVRWLPGAVPGVVAVELDWTLPRDVCVVTRDAAGGLHVRASGYPRPIPGVSVERNLKGISFAVANATGLLTRVVERCGSTRDFGNSLASCLRME